MAPPGSTLEKLFASGFGAVIAVSHASKVMKDRSFEQYAKQGGFTLNAIGEAKGAGAEDSGDHRADVVDRHAVVGAGNSRRRPRHGRAGMDASRPIEDDDEHGGRPRARDLRKQIRARARRRFCFQNRAGSNRQGRLHHRPSGRGRLHQRRHQVVHGPLQRHDVFRRRRAQRDRVDLRRSTPTRPGSRRRRPANLRPPFSTSASGSNTPIRWMRSIRCRTSSKPSCATP
jgi:hypothetical protein